MRNFLGGDRIMPAKSHTKNSRNIMHTMMLC